MRPIADVSLPLTRSPRSWIAPYGWIGVGLVGAAWAVSWTHLRPLSDWGFFPLWLGYIITLDALVRTRLGRSLFQAGPLRVLRLFAISAAVWWIFEAFNLRTDNWHYLHPEPVGSLRFALEATLDFSTVLPAIFETAAFLHAILPGQCLPQRATLPAGTARVWMLAGLICLGLSLLLPRIFFPLIWGCLFLLVDPLNARLHRPSLLAGVHSGVWRPVVVLALSGIVCGFFWEMWNSLSMPKWVYTVPGIPQQRLFEMPLLGYLGYLPFALECFSLYIFVSYWLSSRGSDLTDEKSPYVPMR